MIDDNPIHNYNETLVFDEIRNTLIDTNKVEDEDTIADITCVALNSLKPRYIRFTVDMVFYTSEEEQIAVRQKVSDAVIAAYDLVMSRPVANYKSS